MATRSRTTFGKRQREMKRQEKQRMKAERRAQRSLARQTGNEPPKEEVEVAVNPEPAVQDFQD